MKIIYVFIFCSWLNVTAQYNNFQPMENTSVKFVKVLVHFITYKDGMRCFNETNGKIAALNYIKAANLQLANLKPISLKYNSQQLPTLQPKFRYVISPVKDDVDDPDSDGIYFHVFAPRHREGNVSETKTLFPQYVKHKNTINIFFVDGYRGDGVAYSSIEFTKHPYSINTFCTVGVNTNDSNDIGGGIRHGINHEIGHNLRRKHTWGLSLSHCDGTPDIYESDDCDDTPHNYNCNSLNVINGNYKNCPSAISNCDTPEEVTNNMMDFGQISENVAFTPCQLGGIHAALENNKVFFTNNVLDCNALNITYSDILINNSIVSSDLIGNSILINGNSSVSFLNQNNIKLLAPAINFKTGFNTSSIASTKFSAKAINFVPGCPNWILNTDESTWDDRHKEYFGVKSSTYSQRQEINDIRGISCGNEEPTFINLGSNLRKSIDEEITLGLNIANNSSIKLPIQFNLSPNPSFGECTINNLSSVPYEIEVFNTSGSLVFKESHA
ncbi:MAG: hypothetical protein EAZ27_01410, partial [Cytophagales bacterium]